MRERENGCPPSLIPSFSLSLILSLCRPENTDAVSDVDRAQCDGRAALSGLVFLSARADSRRSCRYGFALASECGGDRARRRSRTGRDFSGRAAYEVLRAL